MLFSIRLNSRPSLSIVMEQIKEHFNEVALHNETFICTTCKKSQRKWVCYKQQQRKYRRRKSTRSNENVVCIFVKVLQNLIQLMAPNLIKLFKWVRIKKDGPDTFERYLGTTQFHIDIYFGIKFTNYLFVLKKQENRFNP